MRRSAGVTFVMAVITLPMLRAHPALADDPSTLFTCPSTLGGLPLTSQEGYAITQANADNFFGAHGFWFQCEYQVQNTPTLGDRDLSAAVLWEEVAVAAEPFYCRSEWTEPSSDIGSNGVMVTRSSPDHRVVIMANEWTDYGGANAIAVQPAIDLAGQMLPLAEARAAACPGVTSGGEPAAGSTDTTGATGTRGDEGTQAEPADGGGSSSAGVPLVVGGLAASVLAGIGSVLVGRAGNGNGGGAGAIEPPAATLFSGTGAAS